MIKETFTASMRKLNLIIFLCSVVSTGSAQNVEFFDSKFRTYLLGMDSINTDSDKKQISFAEALSYTGAIDVSNKKIKSLKGIEAFVNLRKLMCAGNKLIDLDLTKNSALEYLDCKNNEIEHLNLTQNPLLVEIKIYNNKISSIDLTKNVDLVHLSARNNPFQKLDISKNLKLKSLYCQNTKLSELDVTRNKFLMQLYGSDNSLKELDLRENKELVELVCSGNKLSDLYLKENASLVYIGCENNMLTKLDLRNNPKMSTLYSKGNEGLSICILEAQLNHHWYRDIDPFDEKDKTRASEIRINCED